MHWRKFLRDNDLMTVSAPLSSLNSNQNFAGITGTCTKCARFFPLWRWNKYNFLSIVFRKKPIPMWCLEKTFSNFAGSTAFPFVETRKPMPCISALWMTVSWLSPVRSSAPASRSGHHTNSRLWDFHPSFLSYGEKKLCPVPKISLMWFDDKTDLFGQPSEIGSPDWSPGSTPAGQQLINGGVPGDHVSQAKCHSGYPAGPAVQSWLTRGSGFRGSFGAWPLNPTVSPKHAFVHWHPRHSNGFLKPCRIRTNFEKYVQSSQCSKMLDLQWWTKGPFTPETN